VVGQWVKQLPAPYNSVVDNFSTILMASTDQQQKHRLAMNSLQLFLKHFAAQEDGEEVPVLKVMCENVLTVARAASTEGHSGALEEAARLLPRCFTTCITSRTGKKWAALRVVVLLFKIYFRLDTLRLCGNIVRALEGAPDFPAVRSFPKSEAIAYWYYRARLCIHQKDFKQAEVMLSDAFALCHPEDHVHRRDILTYLVPLRLIHGVLPKHTLLREYGLEQEFGQLIEAVRTGNLSLFDAVLAQNQAFYMRKELFLLIQTHLKSLILRTLFRRIALSSPQLSMLSTDPTITSIETPSSTRIPLTHFEAGLAVFGIAVGRDEIECWTAGLIHAGLVKGYIHHAKGYLVLSKRSAFPAPSTLF